MYCVKLPYQACLVAHMQLLSCVVKSDCALQWLLLSNKKFEADKS